MQVKLTDFLLTRRQFPVEGDNKKYKTLALSLGCLSIQDALGKSSVDLIETPYSYRGTNLVELFIISEKFNVTNLEELSIKVALRPIKISVS